MKENKERDLLDERLAGLLEKWDKLKHEEQIGGHLSGRIVETVFVYEDGTEFHYLANEYLAEIYVALIPYDWTPYELELEEKFEKGAAITSEETNYLKIDRNQEINPKRVISARILYSLVGKVPDLIVGESEVKIEKTRPRIIDPMKLPLVDKMNGRWVA